MIFLVPLFLKAQLALGYIINLEGDTIVGSIGETISDKELTFQLSTKLAVRKVPFRTTENQLMEYRPVDIKGYGYQKGPDKWVHFQTKTRGKRKEFWRPSMSGKMNLYILNIIPPAKKDPLLVDRVKPEKIFWIGSYEEEKLTKVPPENYKNILKTAMADCPTIVPNIGKKGMKYKDLELIISVYNKTCQ